MTELEELQAIIDNAPDGAQFYDIILGRPIYVMISGGGDFCYDTNDDKGWSKVKDGAFPFTIRFRSLSDIKRIIELLKEKGFNMTDEDIEGGKVYYKEV